MSRSTTVNFGGDISKDDIDNIVSNAYYFLNFGIIFFIIFLVIKLSIISALIMVIWNKVIIPKFPLSNIQIINFWEALAIYVLCCILF